MPTQSGPAHPRGKVKLRSCPDIICYPVIYLLSIGVGECVRCVESGVCALATAVCGGRRAEISVIARASALNCGCGIPCTGSGTPCSMTTFLLFSNTYHSTACTRRLEDEGLAARVSHTAHHSPHEISGPALGAPHSAHALHLQLRTLHTHRLGPLGTLLRRPRARARSRPARRRRRRV